MFRLPQCQNDVSFISQSILIISKLVIPLLSMIFDEDSNGTDG